MCALKLMCVRIQGQNTSANQTYAITNLSTHFCSFGICHLFDECYRCCFFSFFLHALQLSLIPSPALSLSLSLSFPFSPFLWPVLLIFAKYTYIVYIHTHKQPATHPTPINMFHLPSFLSQVQTYTFFSHIGIFCRFFL